MIECIQIYNSNGEQNGIYLFKTADMNSSEAYGVVDEAWSEHAPDEDAFETALEEAGIERVIVTVEITLDGKPHTKEHIIQWHDNGKRQTVTFGIGEVDDSIDDSVFYWVDSIDELSELMQKDNGEDFRIVA